MNSCKSCNLCCAGHLLGDAFSYPFGRGKPCIFLKQVCTIYVTRPETCKKYQCAYSQGLFDDKFYPPECNFFISVEVDQENKQFLKVIPTGNIQEKDLEYIQKWCEENQTYFRMVDYAKNGIRACNNNVT